MVHDLLALTRVSKDHFPLAPVELSGVLKECLEQSEQDLRARHAEVRVEGEPLPVVLANHTLLCQVVGNLLSNGCKFVAPGVRPLIHVSAERRSGWVRLSVRDNGIGIDPKFHEKIFGVFQRLHPESEYAGSGIGLALVQRGVERMNGRVGVDSEPGKGSVFWIDLAEPTK